MRIIFWVAGLASLFAGDFNWRLGLETGKTGVDREYRLNHYTGVLYSSLRYNLAYGSHRIEAQFRGRFDRYSISERFSGTSNASLEYGYSWGNWAGSAKLSYRGQIYGITGKNLILNGIQSETVISRNIRSVDLFVNGSIYNGKSESESVNHMKVYQAGFGVNWRLVKFWSYSGSVFLERFRSSTNDIFTFPDKNHGNRNGVKIGASYSRLWIVDVMYSIASITSHETSRSIPEHEVHVIFGKSIGKKWGVYFLTDFIRREIKRQNRITRNLLFVTASEDNRMNGKISYDIRSNQTVFMKISVTHSKLIQKHESFYYKTAVLGYELKL